MNDTSLIGSSSIGYSAWVLFSVFSAGAVTSTLLSGGFSSTSSFLSGSSVAYLLAAN